MPPVDRTSTQVEPTSAHSAASASAPASDGPHGLEAVFRPRSVAVIGASRERGTIGAEIFHNLLAHGFQGPVYPVNPKADGGAVGARLPDRRADIPGAGGPGGDRGAGRARAARCSRRAAARACAAAVVISAGFKEIGARGRRARARAGRRCARRYGMRLVGPNCLGVLNTEPAVRLDATFAPTYPPPGRGRVLVAERRARARDPRVRGRSSTSASRTSSASATRPTSRATTCSSSGSSDPGTDVILLYLESFGNPRRFIADRAPRRAHEADRRGEERPHRAPACAPRRRTPARSPAPTPRSTRCAASRA